MKKVVICLSIADECIKIVEELKGSTLLKGCEVHLLHCFETQIYTGEYFMGTFPAPDQYGDIEASINKILDNLGDELGDDVVVHKKCLFSADSKDTAREYLSDVAADLAIIVTRGKHGIKGFFSSSFAEYMVRHSPCDLYILRQRK